MTEGAQVGDGSVLRAFRKDKPVFGRDVLVTSDAHGLIIHSFPRARQACPSE
ncbi:hypothetical protein THTE_0380 [Thermogutta terrifontis]|uniref:Uncharacterized protein n=1 Tax=Thermogutta terrifontis TaxID=1331910 RepID=A0A286RAJ5_9BACT|nr:hypothetical protein THTE_0380 [Thermogutta terrifontis]